MSQNSAIFHPGSLPFQRICVFCASAIGVGPNYRNAAEETGRLLAGLGITIVYGGGRVGLMGALADSALAARGRVVGVMPQALVDREIAHTALTEFHIVRSMHERKALMADMADAFIALPGGFGTLDELCEILTWAQLGIHRKPIGLLNVAGYYTNFLALLDHQVREGLLQPGHRAALISNSSLEELLATMASATPSGEPKLPVIR